MMMMQVDDKRRELSELGTRDQATEEEGRLYTSAVGDRRGGWDSKLQAPTNQRLKGEFM